MRVRRYRGHSRGYLGGQLGTWYNYREDGKNRVIFLPDEGDTAIEDLNPEDLPEEVKKWLMESQKERINNE